MLHRSHMQACEPHAAPPLRKQTKAVLAELGMSPEDVGKLVAGYPRILGISSQRIRSVVDWCQAVGASDVTRNPKPYQ